MLCNTLSLNVQRNVQKLVGGLGWKSDCAEVVLLLCFFAVLSWILWAIQHVHLPEFILLWVDFLSY